MMRVISMAMVLTIVATIVRVTSAQDRNLGVACTVSPNPPSAFSSAASASGSSKVFHDVTAEVGIDHLHYKGAVPPRCLLDDWNSRDKVFHGSLCDPEANTAGVTVGDFDGDGLPDLLLTSLDTSPKLMRNTGIKSSSSPSSSSSSSYAGVAFEDVSAMSGISSVMEGIPTTGAGFADVDADGDLDLYILTLGAKRFYLFINDGSGRFKEEALERGCAVASPWKHVGSSVAFGDFDGDGFLDMHTTAWLQPGRTPYDQLTDRSVFSEMRLLRNLGKSAPGYFEDVTKTLAVGDKPMFSRMWKAVQINGTFGFTSTFIDLDDDGHLDLAVTADFATTQFYWNNGNGSFSEAFLEGFTGGDQNAMGSTYGDYDGDGKIDWFVTGIYDAKQRCRNADKKLYCPIGWRGNYLYRNLGNRKFENRAEAAGIQKSGWAWGTSFIDYDNDGDLDVAIANNFLLPGTIIEDDFNQDSDQFYVNDGSGNFVERGAELGFADTHQGRGLVTVDIDNDGDLDIVVATFAGQPIVFQNDHPEASKPHRWVRVLAFDYPPERSPTQPVTKNRSPALNAKVTVQLTADSKPMVQYIGIRSHLYGMSEPHAHFGFGDAGVSLSTIHKVTISWPNRDATISLMDSVPLGKTLHVFPPHKDGTYKSELSIKSCTISENVAGGGNGKENENDDGNVDEVITTTTTAAAAATAGISASEAADPSLAAREDEIKSLKQSREMADKRRAIETKVWKSHLDERMAAAAESSTYGSSDDVIRSRLRSPLVRLARINNDNNKDNNDGDEAARRPSRNEKGMPINGAAGSRLIRKSPPMYADGFSTPAGPGRVSARIISNVLMEQGPPRMSRTNRNQLLVTFGQFLSHDTDFSTPLFRPTPTANFPIDVPIGDLYFDADRTGREVLRFRRSMYDTASGTGPGNPREQINQITSFIDASVVYGSAPKTTEFLRDGPLMRLTKEGYLPFNRHGISTDNPMGRMVTALNVAGDSRVNVQGGLLSFHTIFAREHNQWARSIAARRTWQSDSIFAAARRIVIAIFQNIVYNEWLPRVLAPRFYARLAPDTYNGYDPEVDPSVANEFATAAFRYGHSQVDHLLWRVSADWEESKHGHYPLRDAYFSPERVLLEGGIDDIVRGMMAQKAQEVDVHVVDDLRNFLFGPSKEAGGLDLSAANIQRGRDHGLADYNTVRKSYGLPARKDFDEISSDPVIVAALRRLYANDINNIDLYVGGIAEDIVTGTIPKGIRGEGETAGILGETFSEILAEQFLRLRDGDPSFYLNTDAFSDLEIEEIEATTLADVISRNTGLRNDPRREEWSKDIFRAFDPHIGSRKNNGINNQGGDNSNKEEL